MADRLTGKVAFITGAARGQGRAHAVRLAAEGADIIAVDAVTQFGTVRYPLPAEDDLAETVRLVEAQGRKIIAQRADVRDLAGLRRVVDDGVAALGRLDVVVANAGIATYGRSLELTEDEWDEMVDINLSGVWRTVRASVQHIVDGGEGGAVVITSSASGLRAIPNAGHYAAAKHGLVGFMKVLALELARDRIRVNTIHPTTVDTGMTRNQATLDLFLPGQADQSEEAFARIAGRLNPMPVPWLQPETVSDLVAFLASDEAAYITGSAIPVDAGMAVRW
ncbi:mycofactocin-coupled SDR family oxidoreductase [uncultured Jatrophihabitans sp.]|uniref:mycofactocin-coupled SDR family oxidoreductase n=1 Tax=uncultured Jatrophihabitans sp. TaxID=1610747 RepID=UPI0035CBDCBE